MSEQLGTTSTEASGPDPYPVKARKLLRETLLDAAFTELGKRDWDEITMADIARTAGVSRQTLYKEFGSRNEFSQAFVLREGERFLATVDEAILGNRDDTRTAIKAAFEVFLRTADDHPLVRNALSGSGADSILPLLTVRAEPVIQFATSRLSVTISEGWPEAPQAEVALLAENLVRLAISYLSSHSRSPADTADEVSRLLGPFADWALAGTK